MFLVLLTLMPWQTSEARPGSLPEVAEVRVEPRHLLDAKEFEGLPVCQPGVVLTDDVVEQSRLNLLATGRFSKVEALFSVEAEKRIVTFSLTPSPYVNRIGLHGVRQVPRWDIVGRLDLRIWRPLSDEFLEAVPSQMKEAYTRLGLPSPEVTVNAGKPDEEGGTRVEILVSEVQLPRLTTFDPDFGGMPFVSGLSTKGAFLLYRLKGKLIGYNRKRLDDLVRKEQRRIRSLGWRGAVFEIKEQPGSKPNSLDVHVALTLGPQEKLKGKNIDRSVMREISQSWRRRNVPLSEGIVNRLARAATEGMKERGYLDIEVTPVTAEKNGSKTVVLEAQKGRRSWVSGVEFEGGPSLSREELLNAALVHSPRWLGLQKSRPGPIKLEESRESLVALLHREGFRDAEVTPRVEGPGEEKTVVFLVKEGKRSTVRRVSFPGAAAFDEARLRKLSGIKEGDPFWQGTADEAAEVIRKAYASDGHDAAKVNACPYEDETGNVALAFEIMEGPRYLTGSSIVAGNFKTRAGRILSLGRQKPGTRFDPKIMAERQTRLSTLGIFDTVSMRAEEVPDSTPPEKTTTISVTERPTGFVEYGLDLNTQRGPEIAATVGERNLFGKVISGSVSVLAGLKRQSFSGSVSQPLLLGLRVYNGIKASYTNDETYDGFTLVTVAAELGFAVEFTPKRRVSLAYRMEHQKPTDIQPDVEEALTPEVVRIGSLTPTFSWDDRDDPFVTSRGTYTLARVKSSRKFLGGDTDFDRFELQQNWYETYQDVYTLAVAGRAGYAKAQENHVLPVGERFFIGGANTHRGFKEKELGPKGSDGSPLGGESYALANVELRFPIFSILQGGAFLDVGNAYLGRIDITDLRWAAGAGLRLVTPVGPLRLDAGYKLDRKEGESAYELHIALGHAF